MSQIITRNLAANSVDDTKVRLSNNAYLRGRNAANSADISIVKVNGSNVIEFASVPQTSATPSNANDFATVSFVQAIAAGLRDPKDACRAASTANLALTGGASLTIDGVTMANGDRVLLKNQTAGAENGIYTVSGIGTAYALTRSTDADTSAEVTSGMSAMITNGTANALTTWLLTTNDPIVLGTTALVFGQVPNVNAASYAQASITLSGTDITNQYVDMPNLARTNSVMIFFNGVKQRFGTDYTVAPSSGISRVTFAGDLATGGASALIATDVIEYAYAY